MACRQVELFWSTLILWWRLARGVLGCPKQTHPIFTIEVQLLFLNSPNLIFACLPTLLVLFHFNHEFVRQDAIWLHPVFVRPRGGSEKRQSKRQSLRRKTRPTMVYIYSLIFWSEDLARLSNKDACFLSNLSNHCPKLEL